MFGLGRLNFKILLLKKLMLLDFLICGSRFFQSFMVQGKKEFLKKSCFRRSWEIFSEFRAKYLLLGEETNWKRYLGDWLLIILNKGQSFLYQRPFWRDSNSSHSFSLEVPFTTPVIANAALYWIDSIFWWIEVLYARS